MQYLEQCSSIVIEALSAVQALHRVLPVLLGLCGEALKCEIGEAGCWKGCEDCRTSKSITAEALQAPELLCC